MMSWNTSTDCCNWDGVSCDDSTGEVIGLELSCGMLQGTIHPDSSLFNLTHLISLDLSGNNLNGALPSWLFTSPSLETLHLENNMFSGNVPFDSFTSPSLTYLDLSFNSLNGTLPSWLFSSPSLKYLYLGNNMFSGNVPFDSFTSPSLTYLDLSFNSLNGTLPSWLFSSPSLKYLYLGYNMFSGNVPFESFALPSLQLLDLSNNNQLGGQIDVQTFRQLTNLTALYLSFNNFSGELELDTLLSSLTNLEFLDLSYSGFSVTTKNAYHYVNPGFWLLKLASCKLKVFPDSFRTMKRLYHLDLSSNEIHGQIPHWAGEIGFNELSYLNLSPNLIGVYELSYLNLSYNFITGLPQFQWYGLEHLYLQSNLIQGTFPLSICNMSHLRYLDMSNNRFGGVIPECVGSMMSTLFKIDLGNNNFHGTIPNVFNECRDLKGLLLNGNQLEGEVPHSLSKCQSLKVLDLGNNNLNGSFPKWLGGLSELQVLVLRSNNFHGPIETSTATEHAFSSLQVLDLFHNCFVGKLPGIFFQNFKAMQNMCEHLSSPDVYGDGDEEEVDESGITWKVVTLGYGCGTLVGLVMGYLMLSTRKVKWFNAIADAAESLVLKKKRRHIYIGK
ncbi:Leucine-rich repeat-containing protein [Artemisia annua]|uniref:Leucine-rich repeat-containing protein n=1 Tax=Artemisia annua TaxID=35608 RepID=A0A2U1NCY6_ARTAN|nr:Leucine-rich repeat-containing protein [Artemisia annua]